MNHSMQLALFANVVFGMAVILVVSRPIVARSFLVISFLAAFGYNIINVLSDGSNPGSGEVMMLPWFTNSVPMLSHDQLYYFTLGLALIHFFIAAGLILKQRWTVTALLLGVVYGIFISSLGGYEFPAALLMSIAFLLLAGNYKHDFLWKWNQYGVENESHTVSPTHTR